MGKLVIIYGLGEGKTTAAMGRGIRAIAEGKTVNMIQFLKGHSEENALAVLERLEPEMKVFRFERYNGRYSQLDDARKQDELINIRNGLNFARKVITTNGCDVLILDEILGLVDQGILSEDGLRELVQSRPESMDMIVTGKQLAPSLVACADVVSRVEREK